MPESVRAVINGRTKAASYGKPRQAAAAAASARETAKAIHPDFASSYGPYGHLAQSELLLGEAHDQAAVATRAANSNTAPGARRPNAAVAPAASETVVPFDSSGRTRAAYRAAPQADPLANVSGSALALAVTPDESEATADPSPTFDVVLSRETATVKLPADDTALHQTIISRLGRALSEQRGAHEFEAQAQIRAELPILEAESVDDHEFEQVSDVGADPEHDDAITIAGRLRPAIPAE